MLLTTPRLVVAGLAGDSGKTLVSLGLVRALVGRGVAVAAYKKGPDYIDAAWLGLAAGMPGRNLDTFMMPPEGLGSSLAKARDAGLILVEGNRGLYDGLDGAGTHSTAELAKRLGAPVILVVDVTKSTRTVAAQVLGCQLMDPDLNIAGVILNRVGTQRQEEIVRQAVETTTGIPVLGAVPRLAGGGPLPGRHLGLVTTSDHADPQAAVERAAESVGQAVDLDGILTVARRESVAVELEEMPAVNTARPCRVAVAQDPAFCFYYPENLEAIEAAGGEIVPFSLLESRGLPPETDAVYLGGGFPEVHAAGLADNAAVRNDLVRAAGDGVPIFAECGGLMMLARTLRFDGNLYPMAGVLDLEIQQEKRPQGHGYVLGRVDRENPWFERGTILKGHEFHYSRITGGEDLKRTVMEIERGVGVGGGRDGIVKGRVWASYLHLHVFAVPQWPGAMVGFGRQSQYGEQAERAAAGV
ncbi:MAG: cobyrinic acid a,c-diamide synthase [Acidobacteria bacterium]|nr:MAG: cobyrinic acid a,c-diamide synthase [Acidobacteriota bacterium]